MGSEQRIYGALAPLGLYRLGSGSRVDAELAAYLAALVPLEQLLEEIGRQAFVQTATGSALQKHERLVGLQERPEAETEARRELVLYRLSVAPFDFTAERMQNSVRAAGIEAELLENGGEEFLSLAVNRMVDVSLSLERIRSNLDSLLPAHLEWELDQGVMKWDELDAADLTGDLADALDMSWDLFEVCARGFISP